MAHESTNTSQARRRSSSKSTQSVQQLAIMKLNQGSGAAHSSMAIHAMQPPPPIYPNHSDLELEHDACLRSFLEDNPHVLVSIDEFHLLKSLDLLPAMQFLHDIRDAVEGVSVPPSSSRLLLGMSNIGNSCYLDSLLFSMFSTGTAFDTLMNAPTLDSGDEPDYSIHRYLRFSLESSIRLIINCLRRGGLVSQMYILRFRKALGELGWFGSNSASASMQQDASELFLFLMDTLGAPFLPLQSEIFHGARSSCDDLRIFTERVIQLSIPSVAPHISVLFEDMLEDHFFSNLVHIERDSGGTLERPVLSFRNSTHVAVSSSTDSLPRTTLGPEPEKSKYIDGWQSSRVLPFLTPESESGDRSRNTPHLSNQSITIPFMIKRFSFDVRTGQSSRIGRRVYIPTEIPFGDFVVPSVRPQDACEAKMPSNHYCLRLRSILCHEGNGSRCGHYTSIVSKRPHCSTSLSAETEHSSTPSSSAASTLSSTTADAVVEPCVGVDLVDTLRPVSPFLKLTRSYTLGSMQTNGSHRSNASASDSSFTQPSRPGSTSSAVKEADLPEELQWMHFDDMRTSERVRVLRTSQKVADAFNYASLNAYMVFYELCLLDSPIFEAVYPFVVVPPRHKRSRRCTIL
ncbi:hypothetical protein BASA50_008540 [Batrachochytrium salamandrivorans]|uniref:ubiquitinyl hydrolase 1 n=1 Tax=Batrachochytrium salamandrivorans TaxID=1357716 RepID=A0ABQ8F6S0_9FUNG|nr:hypothetical protein BASA62_000539 [Batrachochytrium salamandrivorans]KAH6589514.1 hypothetical protein BASA61_005577 [Batrachochytrium salamandrivorans]KAH6591683.1 hypothetical protein BASA50_008540 [Batrachochytrium salamandrivorans]